jgi:PBP1b-binding outer membrane lipoprotein LpoB
VTSQVMFRRVAAIAGVALAIGGCSSASNSTAPPVATPHVSKTAVVDRPTPHLVGLTLTSAREVLTSRGLVLGTVN